MDYIHSLKEKGLDYLLYFYNELNEESKKSLLNQIKGIDFDYIKSLSNSNQIVDKDKSIEPLKGVKKEDFDESKINELSMLGSEILSKGKYAVVTLAGRTGNKTWTYGTKRYV